jgi:hypothetical protein
MKFQANVIFELKADSIAEAGQRLDQLLKQPRIITISRLSQSSFGPRLRTRGRRPRSSCRR